MEESSKRAVHPSLPANYVTLVDLRERWMQKQKQKKLDEDTRNKALPINVDNVAAQGKDGGVGDGCQLEKKQDHLLEEPVDILSNPNPNPKCAAIRISSHGGNRRPIETGSCRWVQDSQPNPPPLQAPRVVLLDKAKALLPPVIRVSQSKPPPLQAPRVVQLDKAKALRPPVIRVSQSKRPPLEAAKVELDGEKMEKKLGPSANKRNNKDGEFDVPVENVDDEKLDEVKMEENKNRRNERKHPKKKNVIQSQPKGGVLDPNDDGVGNKVLDPGFEDVGGNKNVDDDMRAEAEGKLAGLSLSTVTGESSGGGSITVKTRFGGIRGGGRGGRSIAARDRCGGIRGGGRGGRSIAARDWCGGIRGDHEKFEYGVWVKKGEASEIGAVPMEEAGNKRG